MTHPLTNDLAGCPRCQWSSDIGNVVFRYDDMIPGMTKDFPMSECMKEGLHTTQTR